jgi:cellulose synthase/poly-beta-1,6-N-acetylglucosamine synthase-like glycosyltransferase
MESLPRRIIVCDGGSTDGTVDVLKGWAVPAGTMLTVLVEPGANISRGRNQAIKQAKTTFVAVTDAGTRVQRTWLSELYNAFTPEVDVVSGFFEPEGVSPFERLLGSIITPTVEEIRGDSFLPSSRSVAFRRSAWEQAGGYPEWLDYCEDLVFDKAMASAGASFSFAPEAIVTWNARPDAKSFFKQYYRYARGDGKAGLWPRRHALRYAAYMGGALSLVAFEADSAWLLAALTVGFIGYLRRPITRYIRRFRQVGVPLAVGLVLVPALVVLGDIAKMIGYPVGLLWRWSRRREDARSSARSVR